MRPFARLNFGVKKVSAVEKRLQVLKTALKKKALTHSKKACSFGNANSTANGRSEAATRPIKQFAATAVTTWGEGDRQPLHQDDSGDRKH